MLSRSPRAAPEDADFRRRREEYERELESGAGQFFHPPVRECPWCGGADVRFRIRVADTRQCKPGDFDMHECRSCGHVFQNPRLTGTGLAYYYRDFYDGLGHEHYASVAARSRSANRRRARLLAGRSPENWLDVGARHGHFCSEARKVFPSTEFWALDPSPEVSAAVARGWVDTADHRPLTEFAEDHGARFDVVSLIHYLERTPSPQRELDAAREVLREGGVVLIELVNPASRFARLHGRYWYCWNAPQNLNLVPWRNLCRALEERGFEIERVELGAANKPFDNLAALLTALNHRLPPARGWPWLRAEPSLGARLFRKAVMGLAAPVLAIALLVDLLLQTVITRGRGGNAYRVVAVAH